MDSEFCKTLVDELQCVAFDVDYRLAPENKYPIPVEDSWAAFNWVRISFSQVVFDALQTKWCNITI